jgi:tripartite-type tricarboxylate transporter receptor subunit TctC
LNKAVNQIIKTPEVQEKYKELALTPPIEKTPTQFNHYLASEMAKWAKVAALASVKGD